MRIKLNKNSENLRLLLFLILIVILSVSSSIIVEREQREVKNNLFNDQDVMISEIMTDNESAFVNSDGLICDYAIIENNVGSEINLEGWGISDRTYEIRYTFSDVILSAGERLFIYFPGREKKYDAVNGLYTNFGLSSSGETLVLFSPQGEAIQRISIPALGKNEVYAFLEEEWQITERHSRVSDIDYASRFSSGIWINEIMTSNVSYIFGNETQAADIIEIYNGTDDIVNLSDYTLSDNLDHPERFSFKENSVIAPGEYRIILCTSDDSVSSEFFCNTKFSLDSSGESLILYRKSTDQIVDMITIPPLDADYSYARMGNEWITQASPTPGYSNDAM